MTAPGPPGNTRTPVERFNTIVFGALLVALALSFAERTDVVVVLELASRAAVVVLIPGSRNGDLLEDTVTQLLEQQPRQVGGVLLWDVRDLPVPPAG